MTGKFISMALVAGILIGPFTFAEAQTGSDVKEPAPKASNPGSNHPGLGDTVGKGQGTPQYIPGDNRGQDQTIPGEGAGTPPEQHLHKNPKDLRKELPPPSAR